MEEKVAGLSEAGRNYTLEDTDRLRTLVRHSISRRRQAIVFTLAKRFLA